MSYTDQQRGRDLRERLSSRRRQEKVRRQSYHSIRSRSRSPEYDERESDGWRSSQRRDRYRRRGADSSCRSQQSSSGSPTRSRRSSSSHTPFKRETDPTVLARRQKQLDYGKNTLCYQEYIKTVPKDKREEFHPRTPVKLRQTSRRRWDSAVKNWRIHLHYWNDPVKLAELRRRKDSDSDASESESAGSESVASTPERRRVKPKQPKLKTEMPPPSRTDVKQEPRRPDLSAVKQEPCEPDISSVKQEPGETAVKQEPQDQELAAVKQELLDPEMAAVKQEPEQEPMQSEAAVAVKQELADADEVEYDPSLSWADDVEGLAEELAGDSLV